jgi:hypothetical protein
MRPARDLIIFCDRASNAASNLARRLGCRRLYASADRRLRSTSGSLVVNYGTGHNPNFSLGTKSIFLNPPEAVSRAVSKRVSYDKFRENSVPTLDYTRDRSVADAWRREGHGILCRRDGLSGGAGIVYAPKGSESIPSAEFYTRYFPKTHEYRAHVFRGRLIDLTQKRLQNGASKSEDDDPTKKIVRSLENGWVHTHQGLDLPSGRKDRLGQAAISACTALGLDFGAVDILLYVPSTGPRKGTDVLAVCEVNTAPGLVNEATLNAYTQAIQSTYTATAGARSVPIVERPKRKKVRKLVPVTFVSRKGNRITRMRMRNVYE